MANKFTKSVLERQAKEQRLHNTAIAKTEEPLQKAIDSPKAETAPPAAEISIKTQSSETTQTSPVKKPQRTTVKNTPAPTIDLSDFIVRDEGRTAKNKTFYLDAAVIDAIHRTAVAQKVTDSKLVNDILKKILGVV